MRKIGIIFAAIAISMVMSVSSDADEKDSTSVSKPSVQAAKKPKYQLRKKPMTISDEDALKVFKLKIDENDRRIPLEYIQNEFQDNGDDTITDHATGLMWRKSRYPDHLSYERARAYIDDLNRYKFAGFNDWRLPTLDELTSLLTPEKQSNGLYINPIFDYKYNSYWTSDQQSSGGAWGVSFGYGFVTWSNVRYCARAVRSLQ